MLVSTKGRYALRVLAELAGQGDGFVALKTLASQQEISEKYLESILGTLSRAGVIEGLRGKGGGYRLALSPERITVADVLRLTEGTLAPVACMEEGAKPCARAGECRTLPMWREFYGMTERYFSGITIADLVKTGANDDFVI